MQIVSTVAPITSIIANVVGGSGAVVNGLVPEGTNSHTFEPPPSAAKVLEESDVVFINGLVLEEPTKDLAEANIASGAEVCVESLQEYFPKVNGSTTSPSRKTVVSRILICGPTHPW